MLPPVNEYVENQLFLDRFRNQAWNRTSLSVTMMGL